MTVRSALLTTALALCCTAAASADSLYDPVKSRSMFADRKARMVGDVVTVQITEATIATQAGDSAAKRSVDANAGGGTGGFFKILRLIPKATLSGSSKQDGSGSTSRTTKLVGTITCKVSEITPGGQLVLTGERSVKINADTQTIRFHGIVRPEDLSPINSVTSVQVADAQIEVSGKGPIDRHVRPGFLSRIFQFLF